MKSVIGPEKNGEGSDMYQLIAYLDAKLEPVFADNHSFKTHNATLFAME